MHHHALHDVYACTLYKWESKFWERDTIIPCDIKSSFNTGLHDLSREISIISPLTKNWFSRFKSEITSFIIWTLFCIMYSTVLNPEQFFIPKKQTLLCFFNECSCFSIRLMLISAWISSLNFFCMYDNKVIWHCLEVYIQYSFL